MKKLVTIKSHLPAVSFHLDGKYWLACGSQWIEVDHQYSVNELKRAWIKEEPKYNYVSAKEESKTKSYKVAGSKGKTYTVKNKGSQWSCNCPASTFRRWDECKHIKEIKNKVKL